MNSLILYWRSSWKWQSTSTQKNLLFLLKFTFKLYWLLLIVYVSKHGKSSIGSKSLLSLLVRAVTYSDVFKCRMNTYSQLHWIYKIGYAEEWDNSTVIWQWRFAICYLPLAMDHFSLWTIKGCSEKNKWGTCLFHSRLGIYFRIIKV